VGVIAALRDSLARHVTMARHRLGAALVRVDRPVRSPPRFCRGNVFLRRLCEAELMLVWLDLHSGSGVGALTPAAAHARPRDAEVTTVA
jgi:hypothetical protein